MQQFQRLLLGVFLVVPVGSPAYATQPTVIEVLSVDAGRIGVRVKLETSSTLGDNGYQYLNVDVEN